MQSIQKSVNLKNPHSDHVPELRFPEFDGEWEENLLGNIALFSKGKGLSKADIDPNGKLECIRYGELYTEYSEVINVVKSKTNIDASELILSEENDVIIPASGETQVDIATASCVVRAGVALGGDLNIIRAKTDGVFLAYYLNNNKKYEIASLSQGISVVHLYSSQLKTLLVNLPQRSEQQKIASFLTAIDKRIQLLQQKQGKLESYKKGIMQKLFSQELRFKDEQGNKFADWEEKKLGEVCIKNSSNISANTLEFNNGNYKIYGASGYLQNINFYREEEQYVSIVKDGAGVGRLLLCEAKTSVLGTLDTIKPKGRNSLYFLYFLLGNIDFTRYTTGSTIPHIYFKDYAKEKINLPSLREQEKIAFFLSAIDEAIEKVVQQVAQMQGFKKGLLQGMFV